MKSNIRVLAIALGLCFAGAGFAATTPAVSAAPAAVTAPAAAPAAKPALPATPATPATATTAAKPATAAIPATPAAGGGDGKVWVNEKSKVYHCVGSKYYGKTKEGSYMTEADAKAKGNHPVAGKACAK